MQTSQDKTKSAAKSAATHKNSTAQAPLLEITREFKVPVAKVFKAFSSAEAIKAWWWPKGLYADHVEYDFREGGKYFINMKGYDKGGGGMCGEFEDIVPNARIVSSDSFADENGRAISAKEAKMPGTWPEKVYITFEFEAKDANITGFKLSQEGIPLEVQKDCKLGWSQQFDKLESYLEGRKQ